jgi:ECF transporter S component (folate family)
MSQIVTTQPLWKRILFSEVILSKSHAQKIAYVGLMTAICIVSNMFLEFKMFDVQFSVTIFASVLTGILIGPLLGFTAAFLGDLIGFFYNSWGMVYMPWVGLSVATMALISGLVMNGIPLKFKGAGYVKLAIVCVLALMFCTIGINTTGLYYYYVGIGAFSEKAMDYMTNVLGTGATYWGYTLFRLFISGQIYNNLFNYALLFLAVPLLNAAKPLKIHIA